MLDIDFTVLSGHAAFFLIFISFLVKRMLLLRAFAIIASLLSLYYNFRVQGGPLWVPIQWNFLFITVNIYHITRILMGMRPVDLTPAQKQVYEAAFKTMTLKDFRNFYNLGFTRTYEKGEVLIEQDDMLPALFFIVDGEVDIFIDNKHVNKLKTNQFIGEMSYLTKGKTKAKVVLSQSSKIHYWDRKILDKHLTKNQEMLSIVHAAIGTQLIGHIIQDAKNMPFSTNDKDFTSEVCKI